MSSPLSSFYPYTYDGNRRPPVGWLWLTFNSGEENVRFDTYHTHRSLPFVRSVLLLAIGLYFLFSWLDPLIVPAVRSELMYIRALSCLLFGTAVVLTYTKWGIRHFQFLMSQVVLWSGTALVGMVLIAETDSGHTYYAGMILAVMYAHTLLRLRFIYATLTTWFIILLYIISSGLLNYIPYEYYMNNIFFLLSANCMGMFASYWLEYYMKATYWKERLLQEKTEELQKEHQRKTDELNDAREMQLNMLPQQLPGCDKYRFSFSMRAASEVGGDYYDYHLDENGTLTFGIGDATGHGLKASVMVTAMKQIFAEHAGNDDLPQFLRRASHSLHLMGFKKLYMAFAVGRLYDDDRLELSGAGMPPALIYRAKNNTVEQLPLKGLPLGSPAPFPYQKTETYVNPGDIVLLMTDGLAECFNGERELYGYERIRRMLADMAGDNPEHIINRLYEESEQWLNGQPQNDDMTFFVFSRKPEREPAGASIHTYRGRIISSGNAH